MDVRDSEAKLERSSTRDFQELFAVRDVQGAFLHAQIFASHRQKRGVFFGAFSIFAVRGFYGRGTGDGVEARAEGADIHQPVPNVAIVGDFRLGERYRFHGVLARFPDVPDPELGAPSRVVWGLLQFQTAVPAAVEDDDQEEEDGQEQEEFREMVGDEPEKEFVVAEN